MPDLVKRLTISGPYHATGEVHPHLRIDAPDRIVACVYCVDEDWERTRREADTIIAALSTPGGEWKPIETAPKDGTPIVGAYFNQPWAESHREGRIVRCWYQPEFGSFISGCREMTLARGYTFEDGSTRRLHSPDKEDITHWMPLPVSPLSKENEHG